MTGNLGTQQKTILSGNLCFTGPLINYIIVAASWRRPLGQQFSHLSVYQNHLEGLLKPRQLRVPPRVFDLVDLEWSPGISIANDFPGDAAGLEAAL